MRANRTAVLTGPRSFAIESQPIPGVGDSRVRVRLEGCGVCGSNVPVWEGRPWFQYPLAAGAPGGASQVFSLPASLGGQPFPGEAR